ncbi:MAG: glucosyltransferase domain-containing protein [Saprospiraceae bacterium]|nr:glucosyltransferase domain-containing protein [Saprospiraceae bacterium]
MRLGRTTFSIGQFVSVRGPFIIYCLLISLVAFGFALVSTDISVDEEISSMLDTVHPGWLSADRWGMALLNRLLLPGPVIPYFPMILAIVFNIASLLFILNIWQEEDGSGKYLAAVPVLSLPTIAFIYQFNLCSYGYYLGVLLAVLSIHTFIRKKGWPGKIWCILLLSLAVSIYQGTIFVAPTVYFIFLFKRTQVHPGVAPAAENDLFRTIIQFLICFIIALLVHQGVSLLIRNIQDISIRYHTVDSFFTGEFLSSYSLIFTIKEMTAFFTGHKFYIGWINGLLFSSSIISVLVNIYRSPQLLPLKIWHLFLLTAALSSAFMLIIFTGHIWPARAMMAIPFLYGGIIILAIQNSNRQLQIFLGTLVSISFVFNTYLNTRLFYSDHLAWQQDSGLARDISYRAEILFGDSLISEKPTPLVVVGKRRTEKLPALIRFETFGQSLFEWDNINHHRIIPVFKLNHIFYFDTPTASQIEAAAEIAQDLDTWPSGNSIVFRNGMVIVKLGN